MSRPPSPDPTLDPPRRMLRPGDVVDRYVVEGVLGEGGMGVVYAVRHQTLEMRLALKVLQEPEPHLLARARQEGRILARLHHPNLVRVTDAIEIEGAPALVMERVDGPTLAAVLDNGALPLGRAERIFRGIVAGVARVHAEGLVHRDIKPANILLDAEDNPRVADFGIAKTSAWKGDVSLTRTHQGIGTPAYMAPEQMQDASSVDARADVFSLGCVLYHMVCGVPPFWGDMVQVIRASSLGDFAPPSTRAPHVTPALEAVIRGCLAPDRARRIPDCDTILRVLAGAPWDARGAHPAIAEAPAGRAPAPGDRPSAPGDRPSAPGDPVAPPPPGAVPPGAVPDDLYAAPAWPQGRAATMRQSAEAVDAPDGPPELRGAARGTPVQRTLPAPDLADVPGPPGSAAPPSQARIPDDPVAGASGGGATGGSEAGEGGKASGTAPAARTWFSVDDPPGGPGARDAPARAETPSGSFLATSPRRGEDRPPWPDTIPPQPPASRGVLVGVGVAVAIVAVLGVGWSLGHAGDSRGAGRGKSEVSAKDASAAPSNAGSAVGGVDGGRVDPGDRPGGAQTAGGSGAVASPADAATRGTAGGARVPSPDGPTTGRSSATTAAPAVGTAAGGAPSVDGETTARTERVHGGAAGDGPSDAALSITCKPRWCADLRVDGERIPGGTPLVGLKLPAGTHTVSVAVAEGDPVPWTRNVPLASGASRTVACDFVPGMAGNCEVR